VKEEKFYDTALYYRLVALWVVCEAFAGGLMHAAKLPFTGMIVSSLAVSCIIMIAYYIPSRNAVLKATIIVAFFKLILSPHSPPTAYIAVFFQGYLGYVLFDHRKHFKISSMVLAATSLVESAIQRILVLLVIYGNSFWDAVDIYLKKTFGGTFNNYTTTAAGIYILVHLLTGLFLGSMVARLITKTDNMNDVLPYLITTQDAAPFTPAESKVKKKRLKIGFFIIWLFIVVLYIQAIYNPAVAVLPANKIVMIFVRSILIILSWYIFLAPAIMRIIKWQIEKRRQAQYLPIEEIQKLIPEMQNIFFKSWQLSCATRGLARLKFFLKILLINIAHSKPNAT